MNRKEYYAARAFAHAKQMMKDKADFFHACQHVCPSDIRHAKQWVELEMAYIENAADVVMDILTEEASHV